MTNNKIRVTYRCINCGSVKTDHEKQTEPIPSKEIWNLCPKCLNGKNQEVKP